MERYRKITAGVIMLCLTAICVIMTRLTVCASETAQTEVRIIVEDTEDISDAEENSTDNSAEKNESGTEVQTGDETDIFFWCITAGAALLICLPAVGFLGRHKSLF